MSANHGTHSRYAQGCRCDDCREGHRLKAREYSQRKAAGQVKPDPSPDLDEGKEIISLPSQGRVEAAVEAEIGAVSDTRPGLAAVALALARLMDDPTAKNQAPAAAKVLVSVLDKLCATSARQRRGNLKLVRTMTENGGA
jgi:hypothetical protein